MQNCIQVHHLSKTFKLKNSAKDLRGAMRQLLRPEYRELKAVNNISFTVKAGERIAFIGPNGAGKSTTIKMLSGILHPSEGELSVLGLSPCRDRYQLGHKIGTVFGQRSQLWYHLPAGHTFDLLAKVYDLEPLVYRERRAELVKLFQIEGLLQHTVRKLSLGQRMRCEIVASLLHRPSILFLDEPTIGLDVSAKAIIRDLVRRRSETDGTTLFLTSHDTGDMERVCDRVIVISDGEILLDRSLNDLRKTYIQKKLITFLTAEKSFLLELEGVTRIKSEPHKSVWEVDTGLAPVDLVVHRALQTAKLQDITVEDPPMEDIIKNIYSGF